MKSGRTYTQYCIYSRNIKFYFIFGLRIAIAFMHHIQCAFEASQCFTFICSGLKHEYVKNQLLGVYNFKAKHIRSICGRWVKPLPFILYIVLLLLQPKLYQNEVRKHTSLRKYEARW